MNVMNEKNTYMKHSQNNEKDRNVKNTVFDPHHLFDSCKIFMDPRHLRQNFDTSNFFDSYQHFMGLRDPCQNLTHVTH